MSGRCLFVKAHTHTICCSIGYDQAIYLFAESDAENNWNVWSYVQDFVKQLVTGHLGHCQISYYQIELVRLETKSF
jgi:hypothetical protein